MTVTITGSEGFSVVRNMRNGESHELGATNPAFRVEPGEYTITVDGNGAAAGAFAFRLLDLGSAPVLALNSAVSDRIRPSRDNRAYRIDVDAGDRLFIDLQPMSATADRATFLLHRQSFLMGKKGSVRASLCGRRIIN